MHYLILVKEAVKCCLHISSVHNKICNICTALAGMLIQVNIIYLYVTVIGLIDLK